MNIDPCRKLIEFSSVFCVYQLLVINSKQPPLCINKGPTFDANDAAEVDYHPAPLSCSQFFILWNFSSSLYKPHFGLT